MPVNKQLDLSYLATQISADALAWLWVGRVRIGCTSPPTFFPTNFYTFMLDAVWSALAGCHHLTHTYTTFSWSPMRATCPYLMVSNEPLSSSIDVPSR